MIKNMLKRTLCFALALCFILCASFTGARAEPGGAGVAAGGAAGTARLPATPEPEPATEPSPEPSPEPETEPVPEPVPEALYPVGSEKSEQEPAPGPEAEEPPEQEPNAPDDADTGEREQSADAVSVSLFATDGDYTFAEDTASSTCTITAYSGTATNVSIPGTLSSGGTTYTVTAIGAEAFKDKQTIASVTIHAGVTSIGANAFEDCLSLATVTFAVGINLTDISENTFLNCISLASIEIPASVMKINSSAFSGCTSLATVTFADGSGLENIEDGAFWRCSSLEEITIPSSITSIGGTAFDVAEVDWTSGPPVPTAALTAINIENGASASGYSSVDGVLFQASVDHGTVLIRFPAGKSGPYSIPAGVGLINTEAFAYCAKLTQVTVPDSVTTISSLAFIGCVNLTQIDIPENNTTLKFVGAGAFAYCSKLSIFLPPSIPYDSLAPLPPDPPPSPGDYNDPFFYETETVPFPTIYVFYDSAVAQWCRDIGYT